ncbi:MAG: hypothetical protein GC149_14150 [Gammaproteobacteria bacterium]|nr:hypothetical protein [Gammaproteobacteria bacterium]
MGLLSLNAEAHPAGNRIDLAWVADPAAGITGVRITRRDDTYPLHPDDGVVADVSDDNQYHDHGLFENRVYYYSLFPFTGTTPVFDLDDKMRIARYTTAPNGYAGYLYDTLPKIYQRYDESGFLKRFLQVTGGQLDQLHSIAEAMQSTTSLDRINGELLPLLADWIGWRTDHTLEVFQQRREIASAPYIYKAVELQPTIEATIQRISKWDCRSKEYVNNVYASNRPERLNLWRIQRDGSGTWSTAPECLSLDFNYAGRNGYATDQNGLHWLFYHTRRNGRWELWYKHTAYHDLTSSLLLAEITAGSISASLYAALRDRGVVIDQVATLTAVSPNVWSLADASRQYLLEVLPRVIRVYAVNADVLNLGPSDVLISDQDNLSQEPAAVTYNGSLHLFWSAYAEAQAHWRIFYRQRQDARWSLRGPHLDDPSVDIADNPFAEAGVYDDTLQRRSPYCQLAPDGRLWLFWLEKSGATWQLRYNRHDGTNWGTPQTFPLISTQDARVGNDYQVLFVPGPPNDRVIVFWSREDPTSDPALIRKHLVYRVKNNIVLNATGWSTIRAVPKDSVNDNHGDKDPFAIVHGGQVELFWSSERGSAGWSIWHGILTNVGSNTWTGMAALSSSPYSQSAPNVIMTGTLTHVLFRANQHRQYDSRVYRKTAFNDFRYSGAVLLNVRNREHINRIQSFEDTVCYTYDTGQQGVRDDSNRIARDTLGVFLDAGTYDVNVLENGIQRLRPVVQEFMPITDRAVFIPVTDVHAEAVYSYDLPAGAGAHYIVEQWADDVSGVLTAQALASGEDFSDELSGGTG